MDKVILALEVGIQLVAEALLLVPVSVHKKGVQLFVVGTRQHSLLLLV